MFTGYCDVFYYWAKKMLLITILTLLGEFTGEKTLWDDVNCIHRHAVWDFLVAQKPFLIMSFSQEDLAFIACTFDMFPSLILIVLSIELISHHKVSKYLFPSWTHNVRLIQYMKNDWKIMRRSEIVKTQLFSGVWKEWVKICFPGVFFFSIVKKTAKQT